MSQSETKKNDKPARARPKPAVSAFMPRSGSVHIIPRTGVVGSALTAVIAVMCYLGSLTLGLVIVIDKSVDNWTSDISGQVTVQIKPEPGYDTERDIRTALSILRVTRGISGAKVISKAESAQLLEPWLGPGSFLKDLPVPRLIAVTIDRSRPPDLARLSKTLSQNVPRAVLDSHRRWQGQIVRSARTMKLVSYAILTLISLTTAAIVVFATRATMASNRSTVEVLHLIGAHDNYIARLIQWHFLKLGLRAGLIAGVLGAASFFLLAVLNRGSGATGLQGAAVNLIAGPALLDAPDYFAFALIPAAATLIAVITARLAILRMLSHVL